MKLHTVQALRAIAASLVILDHALLELTHDDLESSVTHIAWTLGNTGVYLFFVMSGFIMVYICWDDFGRRSAVANFLRRRFIRIVPLYWLATLAAFAYHRVSETHGAHAGLPDLVYSFAFIPYSGADGNWAPILPQGWTLNYEVMFYLIFAMGLSFPRQIALTAVAVSLGGFVIIGPFLANDALRYLASPIVLWFLMGMGLAAVWRWKGFVEPAFLARTAKILEPLGDASYSTYLAHGVILTVLLRAWMRLVGAPSVWIVPVSLVVATLAGLAIHLIIEKPVLRIATNVASPSKKIAVKPEFHGTG
jgi:exopolysaccharide production protein ExoZ